MPSAESVQSPTSCETPGISILDSTPVVQKAFANTCLVEDEDTHVDKTDMSLPLFVKAGKGTKMTIKRVLESASLYNATGKSSLQLGSPICSHRPQCPTPDSPKVPEDAMKGVEDTSIYNSELGGSGSGPGRLIQVLGPKIDGANKDGNVIDIESDIRIDWLGTSPFFTEHNIQLQDAGYLDGLIAYRKALTHDISISPYDPSFLIDLSSVDSKLGFTDTGVASAHRALVLVEAALNINTHMSCPPHLGTLVRNAIGTRLKIKSSSIITEEIEHLHLQLYRELVNGLLGCADFWDGLIQAKEGLKRFHNDTELLEMQSDLKTGFMERHHALKEVLDDEKDLVASTRTGKIYQKKYPWTPLNLHIRTPALLRYVNTKLAVVGKCEVKPVVFGPPHAQSTTKPSREDENEDVGPLGIFAARDIKAKELIMVDKSMTGTSDISPSKLQHCEACHATLVPPYLHPRQIIRPTCCRSAAFCSKACHDTALSGYHRVICKKNFDWLFENQGLVGKEGCGTRWRPILFLRVVAVILADFQKRSKSRQSAMHPLQHPLIARMSANYPPADKVQSDVTHDWQYFENVIAPTRILIQLGIDIFTNIDWTPEVIQTIFWRIENNANMARTNLTGTKTVMVNLNPNYLFFNHSCEPNVSWHGAVPSGDVSIEYLCDMNGEVLNPGCSAVWCSAARDIQKGEELKISYIGDPLGKAVNRYGESGEGRPAKRAWLEKWFDRGCGCRICEEENIEIGRLEKIEEHREEDVQDTL